MRRTITPTLFLAILLLLSVGLAWAAAVKTYTGTFPDGATYLIQVPSNWNGTLVLYSHGYVVPGSRIRRRMWAIRLPEVICWRMVMRWPGLLMRPRGGPSSRRCRIRSKCWTLSRSGGNAYANHCVGTFARRNGHGWVGAEISHAL